MAKQPFEDLTTIADKIQNKYNLEWKGKTTTQTDDLTEIADRLDQKLKKQTEEYVGITEPEYGEDYGVPEGFIDYDSLGATREERLKKSKEQLGVKESIGSQFPGQIPFAIETPETSTANVFESLLQPETTVAESTLSTLKPIQKEDVLTIDEIKKQERQEEGTRRLIKSLQDYEKGTSVFGTPNAIQLAIEHEKKIKENPYSMTSEEAEQYYAQNQHLLKDLTNTSRRMLKDIPVIGQITNTLLYHVNPEGFRYAVADELRQNKSAVNKYADYAAEFAGSLAGLFSIGGGIHQGVNTIKAIETLAKTNPKIAKAISAFISGTTYGGLGEAEKLASGLVTPEGAIANSLASGLVWTAFTQVGTKDWLKLQKKITPTVVPEGQSLQGFIPKWKTVLNGQKVNVGYVKDKGFLSTQIGNWLIDTGIVTAVGTVSHKVARAVDDSERNDTPLVKELQKQFTEIDLTQTGIEFAINAIFTGSIPKQYGKMPPPSIKESKIFEQKLLPGERKVDETVRQSMKPISPFAPTDIKKPFVTPTTVPPPVKTPEEKIQDIELTPEPPVTELQAGMTIEEETPILENIVNKVVNGETLSEQETQLQSKYPNYIKTKVRSIQESPEFKQAQSELRQQEKQKAKLDTDNYVELSRQFKNAQRKRNIYDVEVLREGIADITSPEIKTKAETLLVEAEKHNQNLTERNKFTLENLSRKKYGTMDLRSLTEERQQGLLNEYNAMKKQGITEFKQIQTIKPIIKKGVTDAIQERSPEEILQREPEETGITGGERGGIQPSIKGEKPTEKGKQEEITEAEKEGFLTRPGKEETQPVTEIPADTKRKESKVFYRGGGEGSMPRGKTAQDVINYETKELGNNIQIEPNIKLGEIPSEKLVWLTEEEKDAIEYGDVDEIELEGEYRIIARDQDGGILVEKNYREIEPEPTEAQKEAGNYKKGHIKRDELDISIENLKGSTRSGTDKSGKKWEIELQNDYGYIKGTLGKDKDHLDVFLSEDYQEDSPVFIVNQTTPEGKFDEHKVMLGFTNIEDAEQSYVSNYEEGKANYSDVVEMSMDEFKEWSKDQELIKKPAKQKEKYPDNAFAVKLKSGKIIADADAKNHTEIVEKNNINEDDVIDIGFIKDNEFLTTKEYTDKVKSEIQQPSNNLAAIKRMIDEGKSLKQISDALNISYEEARKISDEILSKRKPIEEVEETNIATDAKGYPIVTDNYGYDHTIKLWGTHIVRTSPVKEEVTESGIKTSNFTLGGLGWEWWGFKKQGDIWEGYVEGFENEFGSFSESELKENGVKIVTDPKELQELNPPIEWKWKQKKATAEKKPTKAPEPRPKIETKPVKPKDTGIIDKDMTDLINGLLADDTALQLKKPQQPGYKKDIGPKAVTGKKPIFRSAAIKYEGKVYEGINHWDATDKAGIRIEDEVIPFEDYGFVTNEGKFVSTIEAEKLVGEVGVSSEDAITNKYLKKPTAKEIEKVEKKAGKYYKPLFQLKPGERISPEKQLKAIQLVEKFIGKEVYEFNNMVFAVEQAFGRETIEKLLPALKAGYTAYLSNVSNEVYDKMDKPDYVRKFTLDKPEGKVPIEGRPALHTEVRQLLIDVNKMTPAQADYKLKGTDIKTLEIWKKELTERAEAKGETGISRPFIQRVREEIRAGNVLTKTQLENIAKEFDITDPNVAKEQAELAIVAEARKIISETKDEKEAYDKVVQMYQNQPNLTHRTNISVENQQYSTPAPISYVAGLYVADGVGNGDVLEPSAGNGMLVIAFNTGQVYVNEIDEIRNANLRQTGYEGIANIDAEKHDNIFGKKFDGIITNPPFGSAETKKFNDYKLVKLEHIMAANALKQMQKDGRAAIIIGGHNRYDNKGRLQNDRTFFNWLNHHYNVDAVLNISGDLYKKQGTQSPIRLILINGRKEIPQGAAPLFDAQKDAEIKDFEDLYNRIKEIRNETLLRSEPNAERGLGGTSDVRSPGRKDIQKPGRTETIPEKEISRPDTEKPSELTEVGDTGLRPSGTGEPISGKPGRTGRPDIGKPTLPGSASEQGKGKTGSIDTGRSGKDIQRGFNREPASVTPRTILEVDKPFLPYKAESGGVSLDTVIPRNMSYETSKQLKILTEDVGGDIDQYVVDKLEYKDKEELYSHLGAEQIDAVALAIVAIEKNQGMIIGDMTGVGKGRIAASVIRYAVNNGFKPIFFTEKADLFSDFYRDLVDTGNKELNPFIVNSPSSKNSPDIVDEDGNVIHKAYAGDKKNEALRTGDIGGHDFVLCTYYQVNSEKRGLKRNFVSDLAEGNIVVLDESHNASGDSNTGIFFSGIVQKAKGVTYLSATFAKRPDNMPIYAVKTAISEANLTESQLVEAIEKGGVALQEIVSTDMVEAGQMIRREKSYEGIKIGYKPLVEKKSEHTIIVDNVTGIIRDIIDFQSEYIKPIVDGMDTEAAQDGERVAIEGGTNMAGVDNTPFASKVFNVIDQLLFSLKADSAADEAIQAIKKGQKPVIAVKNTMESFLDYLGAEEGEIIENTDFSTILERGLKGLFRIRRRDATGEGVADELSMNDLSPEGRAEYKRILDKINTTSVGITISPIDHIIYRLNKAGYKVGEITGRDIRLKFRDDGKAIIENRTEKDKKKILREYNNWGNPGQPRGVEGDKDIILIINSSGSTGRSAHSSPKFKDQRQRMMVTVQIELNINTEIQKRGRINRTGQVNKPEYVTLSSAIPAEQRLLMMAKKKLKSLDANVSSDQSQAGTTFEANDFLNKYGDRVVIEYLKENRELNDMLLDPLRMNAMNEEELEKFVTKEDAAHKVTGRVAILPTQLQEEFYKEIGHRYDDFIEYKDSIGENDLEVKVMPLEALTTNSRMLVAGKGGVSPFGKDSMLETAEINVLKKPHRMEKINEFLEKYLEGKGKEEKKKELIADQKIFWKGWVETHVDRKKEVIAKDLKISKEDLNKHLAGGLSVQDMMKIYPQLVGKEVFIEMEFSKYADLVNRFLVQEDFIINNIFGRYEIGSVYKLPLVRDNVSPTYSNAIFLGWDVNPKRKNPYAPSAIKLKFAVADSRQIVPIPASQRDWLNDITSESYSLSQWQKNDILSDWDNALPDNRRELKNIVTGNILQAVGDVKGGQLISYTTKDGGIKRGILIKDNRAISSDEIRVPIKRARKFIQQIDMGDFIESVGGEITLINERDRTWSIEVPASKAKGGKYYLDEGIKKLVKNGRFDKWGNTMKAELSKTNLDAMIDLLQDDFGISVRLSQEQIKRIGDDNLQLRPGKIYKDSFGNDVPVQYSKAHEFTEDNYYLKKGIVDFEIIPPQNVYWTREHIKSYDYSDDFIKTLPKLKKGDFGYEEGKEKFAVQIGGAKTFDSETGRWRISISSTATPSAYSEEIIHYLQEVIGEVSPEMARRINEWESDLKEVAKAGGISIPEGYETFAQAMVFTHLGYAEENPDVAELFEVPKDIRDWFTNEILNKSISGKANISDLLKGESQREAIRLPSGKIDNSLQNFRQKRQGMAIPSELIPIEDKRIKKGQEVYAQLKSQFGPLADVYPQWHRTMRQEYGKEFERESRKVWNEMKGILHQLKPAPKELIEKVESKGLVIDKNSIATYKIKGEPKEYVGISTPDKAVSRIFELSKLDEGLKTFPPTSLQLKKPKDFKKPMKDREERFFGKKTETEIAREQGREPESGEGNVVDFGAGLGNVFTATADKINEFVRNNKLEKEFGIESDPKLKKLYRELLTAPQWFFDKEPQLKRVWDIIDRHFVRNVNEETAILREDKWKNSKTWRKLTDIEHKEFLSALEEYEQTQYELQRDGDDLELLDWADYADEFALTPKVTEFLFTTYKPTIETALDMVKDVDRYKIINETEHNPYLQNYYEAKGTNVKQQRLDNELDKAKTEFFDDDPNSEALYENELANMVRNKKPVDEVKALELVWKNNPNLRETLAEVLIDKKYERIDGKAYFPSSRLDKKYYLSGFKKTTSEEKLLQGKFDDRFFTTNENLSTLEKIKTQLETQGYNVKVGKFADAQEEILQNAVTQEDILDLALSAGIEQDNPTLERLVKTIQAKGFSRHFIPKRFIPGFGYNTKNFEEAIFKYIGSVPFYKNRTIGSKELGKTMGQLKHQGVLKPGSTNDRYVQDLKNKIENRDVKLSQALRAVASTYYLALSPAYLSQQIVQPLNTLLPLLPITAKELGLNKIEAEKAFGEALYSSLGYWAWKVFDKINRMTGRPTNQTFGLDPSFLTMMRSLERQGVGKPLRSLELVGHQVDPKKHYADDAVSKAGGSISWIAKIAGMPGIMVEDFTRTIGIRALYTLGKKAGLRGDKLEDFISTNIAKSYGPASGRLAKPPGYYIAGEGRTKPVKELAQSVIESWLTFKNFAFMNYGQWGKTWRVLKEDNMFRPMAYKLGSQIGLAGLKYMMWTSSILTLLSGLYALLNVTEDPEEQYEELFLHFNKLVPGLGDALYRGIASITFKVDLSALFAQTAPIEEPFTKDVIQLIGGAPASAAKDIIEGRLPRAARGFQIAGNWEEGGVKLGSRKLIPPEEITEEEKTKRKLGYNPLRMADVYQKENTRQFKSKQYTDIIRNKVEDEIIPLIEKGRGKEARQIFAKLYEDMKADSVLTEGQMKSITGVNGFISQVVLTRLKDSEREIIKNWKNNGKQKINSRDRSRSGNRDRTR